MLIAMFQGLTRVACTFDNLLKLFSKLDVTSVLAPQ